MKLQFLGHACFLLDVGVHKVLTDPFLTGAGRPECCLLYTSFQVQIVHVCFLSFHADAGASTGCRCRRRPGALR